jgi:DNA ligase-1
MRHDSTPFDRHRRDLLVAWAAACLTGAATAEPRTAPALLLAQDWQPGLDPRDYLVSEKLDGVRAYWDGQRLLTRSGLPIRAPAWFTGRLPLTPLDGELWLGRRQFDAVSALVRSTRTDDAAWQRVTYQVFEMPDGRGTFEQRALRLRQLADAVRWPGLQAVVQQRVPDEAALQRLLADIVQQGGEGLMLHRLDAPYIAGRNAVLRKFKPLHDAEAIVIGHHPGTGKYRGQLGALEVQDQQGHRFKLGTGLSDAQRRAPPAVGSTVTYTYRDVTPNGIPRFAAFLRERHH